MFISDETRWVFVCNPNQDVEFMTFSRYDTNKTDYNSIFKGFVKFLKFVLI